MFLVLDFVNNRQSDLSDQGAGHKNCHVISKLNQPLLQDLEMRRSWSKYDMPYFNPLVVTPVVYYQHKQCSVLWDCRRPSLLIRSYGWRVLNKQKWHGSLFNFDEPIGNQVFIAYSFHYSLITHWQENKVLSLNVALMLCEESLKC